jgi:hypothetical protein
LSVASARERAHGPERRNHDAKATLANTPADNGSGPRYIVETAMHETDGAASGIKPPRGSDQATFLH